jgi:hypothetical protein
MPAGDILTGYSFVPAEKNIDNTKLNSIVGQASIQPAFISAQTESTSSTTGDYYLLLKAGGTLAKIMSDNVASSLASSSGFQSQIWSTRLRSFNVLGNPNFEVDQRNVGTLVAAPANGAFFEDRWAVSKIGTMVCSGQQVTPSYGSIVPGTNFLISKKVMRFTLTTTEPSLAAGDTWSVYQTVEGAIARELGNDVHSVSILCQSSVANLKFSLYLQDPNSTHTLVKLCSLGPANTSTLITLPNLPLWPAAGSFQWAPGTVCYYLGIVLACGSSLIAPAADTWQNGNFAGAPGMSNFAASPVNSTFDLQFVQHEPGPQCTTLIDKPFSQNYDECLRYYCKSLYYGELPGTGDLSGTVTFNAIATTGRADGNAPFPKPMAATPTVTLYDPSNGTANQVYNLSAGGSYAGAAAAYMNNRSFLRITAAGIPNNVTIGAHYASDTGW